MEQVGQELSHCQRADSHISTWSAAWSRYFAADLKPEADAPPPEAPPPAQAPAPASASGPPCAESESKAPENGSPPPPLDVEQAVKQALERQANGGALSPQEAWDWVKAVELLQDRRPERPRGATSLGSPTPQSSPHSKRWSLPPTGAVEPQTAQACGALGPRSNGPESQATALEPPPTGPQPPPENTPSDPHRVADRPGLVDGAGADGTAPRQTQDKGTSTADLPKRRPKRHQRRVPPLAGLPTGDVLAALSGLAPGAPRGVPSPDAEAPRAPPPDRAESPPRALPRTPPPPTPAFASQTPPAVDESSPRSVAAEPGTTAGPGTSGGAPASGAAPGPAASGGAGAPGPAALPRVASVPALLSTRRPEDARQLLSALQRGVSGRARSAVRGDLPQSWRLPGGSPSSDGAVAPPGPGTAPDSPRDHRPSSEGAGPAASPPDGSPAAPPHAGPGGAAAATPRPGPTVRRGPEGVAPEVPLDGPGGAAPPKPRGRPLGPGDARLRGGPALWGARGDAAEAPGPWVVAPADADPWGPWDAGDGPAAPSASTASPKGRAAKPRTAALGARAAPGRAASAPALRPRCGAEQRAADEARVRNAVSRHPPGGKVAPRRGQTRKSPVRPAAAKKGPKTAPHVPEDAAAPRPWADGSCGAEQPRLPLGDVDAALLPQGALRPVHSAGAGLWNLLVCTRRLGLTEGLPAA